MGILSQTIKKLFLQAGYTVLRGDLRRQIKDNAVSRQLSPHLVTHARVCVNRYEVLKSLPKGGTAVEVGVAYGDFTRHILETLHPDTFIAIDSFEITWDNEPAGRTYLRDENCNHLDYYCQQFKSLIKEGNMIIKKGLSWEMLAQLPDHSIDYIYLDADHSYDSVSKDIRALKNKIKTEGILQFNDYTLFDGTALMPYGVPKAVHEFMEEENYEMLYLCLHPEGFYDVVLRKLPVQN